MRIWNSQSLFASLEGRHFDRHFLVEEVNQLIGWSFCPLRRQLCEDIVEDKLNGNLQPVITGEMK